MLSAAALVLALLAQTPLHGEINSERGTATFDEHSVNGPCVSLLKDSAGE